MIFQRKFSIALLCFFLAATTACFTADNRNARGGGGAANVSASPTGSEAPRVLDAKWYQDSDGNAIPDFIETAIGYDPTKDDCDSMSQCGGGAASEDLNLKQTNALLILDSSGSMRARAGGASKIEAAKTALADYVERTPPAVRMGFMVYGHKGNNQASGKAESCAGIELLAPLGGINKANAREILSRFQPVGWTPLAASLEKAREAFQNTENGDNRIILVSDGIETCGGNPAAAAEQLNKQDYKVTVDVVGFDVSSTDAEQLRKIAQAGGGVYTDAKTQADLVEYFKKQGEAWFKTITAENCNLEAFNNSNGCEYEMLNKAFSKINDAAAAEGIRPFGETAEKWKAVQDLKQRIKQLSEQRREQRKALLERADELRRRRIEIDQQTSEGFNKAYSTPK